MQTTKADVGQTPHNQPTTSKLRRMLGCGEKGRNQDDQREQSMMIPEELQARLDNFKRLAALMPEGDQAKKDLTSAASFFLNIYAFSKDMDYDTALGIAESIAMAHPNYERAVDHTAMEHCLKMFFFLQSICESVSGKQPWMRSFGDWAKIVFRSAMNPMGIPEWNVKGQVT